MSNKAMKKTHWLRNTLITLVACGIAGLILAVILFNANPGRTGATSSIEFRFDGAAEGLAPNGLRYDVSGFTSDEVLNAALEETGLAGKYTADQLRENILVSGVYPKDIVDQMTGYESLLTGDAGKVAAAEYHATLYNVALYNDFDKSIARADLEKLLASIMEHFRTRFEKTYSVILAKDTLNETISEYDYPQQLELMEKAANRYEDYAAYMAEEHPDFLKDGESFADLATKYNILRTSDLQRLSGQVTMNALSVDQERIASQYENQIRILEIGLKELQQEAEDIKALIAKYSRDDIIYVSTTGSLQQISGNTATYDAIVAEQKNVENQIASKNKELEQLKLKLADIRGEESSAAETAETETKAETAKAETAETETKAETAKAETAETETKAETAKAETGVAGEAETEAASTQLVSDEDREAQKAVVEKGIASAMKKLTAYTDEFSEFLKAYSEREMNDSTVAITKVRYSTPKLLSGSFIKQAIKTAGPFCVLGFLVCIICMIVGRVKEDKEER